MTHLALRLLLLNLFLLALCPANAAQNTTAQGNYTDRAEVQAFIDNLVTNHGFDKTKLNRLFAQVSRQQKALGYSVQVRCMLYTYAYRSSPFKRTVESVFGSVNRRRTSQNQRVHRPYSQPLYRRCRPGHQKSTA